MPFLGANALVLRLHAVFAQLAVKGGDARGVKQQSVLMEKSMKGTPCSA